MERVEELSAIESPLRVSAGILFDLVLCLSIRCDIINPKFNLVFFSLEKYIELLLGVFQISATNKLLNIDVTALS